MPRGIRALSEISPRHQMARSEPLVGYWPVSTWLPVMCMCERTRVVALQRDVREGVPYSCGRAACVGIPTPVVLGSSQMLSDPGTDACSNDSGTGAAFDRKIDALIAAQGDRLGPKVRPARARAHVVTARSVQAIREAQNLTDRIGRGTVGWRRQDVAQLWRENLPTVTIAKRLGIDVATVADDLKLLAARGRIPGLAQQAAR